MTEERRPTIERIRQRLGPVGAGVATGGPVPAATWRTQLPRIEALGYRAAWPNEGLGGRNAFAQVGVMLSATDALVVGTGIATIWARHPATMHAGGRTIADAFPDRFVLGVGVSGPAMVEPLTGQPFGRPIERMRGYLEQMDVEAGAAPPTFARIVAALGPRMLELARDHADGALPHAMPVAHTAHARTVLGPDKLLVVGVGAYLDEAGDVDRARATARGSGLFQIPVRPTSPTIDGSGTARPTWPKGPARGSCRTSSRSAALPRLRPGSASTSTRAPTTFSCNSWAPTSRGSPRASNVSPPRCSSQADRAPR
jgi:probable F420-dependent oxidoreductase